MSGGHHFEGGDKSVAVLIAVLAAGLAICEAAGKSAQTAVLHHQIEASTLWSFFQAKTIRRTAMIVGSDRLKLDLEAGAGDAGGESRG